MALNDQERRGPVWRQAEFQAAMFNAALAVMIPATLPTFAREPFYLVLAYDAFYVCATALVGLVLGLLLMAGALVTLHVRDMPRLVRRGS